MVYEDTLDVTELLDRSEDELFRIAEGNIKHEVAPIHEVISRGSHRIEELGKKEDALVEYRQDLPGLTGSPPDGRGRSL